MADVLERDAVRLGLAASGKADAVRQAGAVLVEVGAAAPAYVDAMLEREASVSTYMGEGVAIPHGTDAGRAHVLRTALAVLQFPDGVDWDGEQVVLCLAIASSSDAHVEVLSALADVLMDPDAAARLRSATDPDEVLGLLAPRTEELPA